MDEEFPVWKKGIRYAARSDIGLRRANNQDSYAVKIAGTARQWLDRGHLFVVADGMGAHVAGEVASRLAVETVVQSYLKRTSEAPAQAIVQAVYDAHRLIKEKSHREDAYRDMGTTCDAFVMTSDGLVIAHVGDSRVYRIRRQVIEQLTFDHSLVWEVCVATNLPFNQAPSYIPKNQITRSLGPTEKLVVDKEGPFPIEIGDTFLACSDGLSGPVRDREIGELVTVFPPEIAAETLVNLANLRGGSDNCTVVIAQAVPSPENETAVENELKVPLKSWIVLGAALLIAVIALFVLFNKSYLFAGILAAGAFAAFCCFFISAKKNLFRSFTFSNVPPSGKSPYTSQTCPPSFEFAAALAKIYRELLLAAKEQKRQIQVNEAERYEREAIRGAKLSDTAKAVSNYAMAINVLMRELKKPKATPH
ncbi:MAG: protein phosphatase 2C domain-containing protein [Planctomycetaceae bacterium]|jgi:protein phosphatase|nr:protein phosphatase 2C domain-containing protein [Planctomycetaceae bacterium]